MYSKMKVMGHPLHPMLIAFPVTFYVTTLGAYIAFAATQNPFWFRVGFVANVAGVLMALVAAIPGFVDWSIGIPKGTMAKETGLKHMLLNLTALAVFTFNALLQSGQWNNPVPDATGAVLLSLIGVSITAAAGYLGWALVQTHHVGVDLTPEQEKLEPKTRRAGKWTTA